MATISINVGDLGKFLPNTHCPESRTSLAIFIGLCVAFSGEGYHAAVVAYVMSVMTTMLIFRPGEVAQFHLKAMQTAFRDLRRLPVWAIQKIRGKAA